MAWYRQPTRYLVYAGALVVTVLVTIVLVFSIQARLRLADLSAWHTLQLTEEFRADSADAPGDFAGYLALEERLFAELRRRIVDDPLAADSQLLGRYTPGSLPSRLALETPWNRSAELVPADIRGTALLVHGLSDSPYSMRTLAETLYEQGYYVLLLRMPGHGTLPAGLVDVSWQDWYEAVVLAARHAAAMAPDRPFIAGGHSTGAALATLYAVRSLDDDSLPRPDRLYLNSAAIGISPFAFLTGIVARLAFIPAFEKSRWLDVYPEYDPYKYNSFPVNAANQIYRVTRQLEKELDAAGAAGTLQSMPQVTMFQSLVDSTVTPEEVVRGLLSKLPGPGNELVVFDVNRFEQVAMLAAPGPLANLERLRLAESLPFTLTIIGNRGPDSRLLAAYVRRAGEREFETEDLPFEWPAGVFSLGHVALPFPPDDPVYGIEALPGATRDSFNIGALMPRGENGALVVPLGQFSRLRSNPFFDVIRSKLLATLPDSNIAVTPAR